MNWKEVVDQLRALSPERRANLLERLKRTREAGASSERRQGELARIPRATRGGLLPLSYAQERLWFLDQLQPGTTSYNMPSAKRLVGDLDERALLCAFDTLVARHESLRTTFEMVDGRALQRVHDPRGRVVEVEDASSWDEGTLRKRVQEEAETPFDLGQGPLLRVTLLRRSAEERILLLSMHHIVSDGWSMDILWHELNRLYEAFRKGEPNPLPELEIQYTDFAIWQREYLNERRLSHDVGFWKVALEGAPAALELPTDHPRPTVQTYRGSVVDLALGESLTKVLHKLAQSQDATLFMVLLASYGVLLGRHANQRDVVVGTPIANRTRVEIEPLIGFFVNTLALRVRFEGDPTFAELVERVKRVSVAAFDHQDLPFEKVVEVLNPVRDTSRSPVFQAMFVLQNTPRSEDTKAGLAFEPFGSTGLQEEPFDLTLSVVQRGRTAFARLNFDADLFDQTTMQRLTEHWLVLLGAACDNPTTRCSELPVLTRAERQLLLLEWNGPVAKAEAGLLAHELVEEQARRVPDAVAVIDEERSITYQELVDRAARLSHALRRRGVRVGDRVALSIDRSAEAVVGILATLRTGATYVPVALDYPTERMRYILSDAAPQLWVVDDRGLVEHLPEYPYAVLSEITAEAEWRERSDKSITLCPMLPAYMIYTSGSTGQPKGTVIAHAGIPNVIIASKAFYGFNHGVRSLQLATLAFDTSVEEIIGCLANGSTLVVARDDAREPHALQILARKQRVAAMALTPSLLRVLHPDDFPTIRHIVVGGEAIDSALVGLWSARVLMNTYGPTEFTITAVHTQLRPGEPVSIGRPLANVRAYVVDSSLDLAPIGIPGELCLAGIQLAHGYHARPRLTADRFAPDPFAEQPGGRMYRTGDLVRWRPDGNLEFLGRIDHQVKIRGFRIELGEIESQLAAHPLVRDAVVLAREDVPGDKRLVAYFTLRYVSDGAPPIETLRDYLKSKLPEYMIPSAWVVSDVLPLTPNGKVDRKGLPSPEITKTTKDYVAPRSLLEEQLCAIFAEVLNVPKVGVHDDFFSLGGHSLLAVALMAKVRRVVGSHIPLATLIRWPTVAQLSSNLRSASTSAALVPLNAAGRLSPLYCVHAIGGTLLPYIPLASSIGGTRPVLGFQSPEVLGEDQESLGTVDAIATSYVDELIDYQPEGALQLAGWSFGGLVALEMARHLQARGRTIERLILIDSWLPNGEREPDAIHFCYDLLGGRMSPERLTSELTGKSQRHKIQLMAQLARRNALDLSDDDVDRHFITYCRNAKALALYKPRPFDGDVLLVRTRRHGSHDAGWRDVVRGRFEMKTVDGDHYSIMRPPAVLALAELFR
jgi:amino acid adenylation domain-containing protein